MQHLRDHWLLVEGIYETWLLFYPREMYIYDRLLIIEMLQAHLG